MTDRICSCQNRGEKLINILSAAVWTGILHQGLGYFVTKYRKGTRRGSVGKLLNTDWPKLNPQVMNSLGRLIEARKTGNQSLLPNGDRKSGGGNFAYKKK